MARIADPYRRTALLVAARAIFVERGYRQACIADIAGRAGVAPGTIYLYFDSKEAMVLALAEQFFTQLADITLPALADADIATAIREGVHEALHFALREHDLLKLVRLDSGLRSLIEPLPARQAFLAALTERLAAWQIDGLLQRHAAPIVADLIVGLIERAAESITLGNKSAADAYERAIVDMLQHVLLTEGRAADDANTLLIGESL